MQRHGRTVWSGNGRALTGEEVRWDDVSVALIRDETRRGGRSLSG